MSEAGAAEERVPFLTQVRALGRVYWIANWMELVERFAYYGVRVVLPVFMVLAISDGGPELTHSQKGTIYAIWALVQSFVPVFSGNFADRYGYRINIAISTVLKLIGYLVMGYCIRLAELHAGMPLAEAREQGVDLTYEIFFAGAMLLATGTAVFKPGLQGLIAHAIPRKSDSLGWGIFYQMVNIGGFIGPMIAGYLRVLSWENVFLACAGAIALNFIPLFFIKEPEKTKVDQRGMLALLADALRGLMEPRLFFFTLAFAGFWLMFYQLFDILPNFIDDWIDSRAPRAALESVLGDAAVPDVNGGNLTQEWMINVNAGLISIFAFLVGYYTGRMRALTAIMIGIALSAVAIHMLGWERAGWLTIGAIGLFSVGEMMASPTKMRYLSALAPPGRKGQYMGYVNMTVGIGWSIGSIVAGEWYEQNGDKVNLARRYLVEQRGFSEHFAENLDRGHVMAFFEGVVEVDAWEARALLWNAYEPYGMWLMFTIIGLVSMVLLFGYDRLTRYANAHPSFSFNTKGHRWVQVALVPVVGAFVVASVLKPSLSVVILTVVFGLLFLASFVTRPDPADSDPSAT